MKPGWKTTEFWLTLATSLWGVFGNSLPPLAQAIIPTVATAAYTIGRAIAKMPVAPANTVGLTANNLVK